MQGHVLSIPNMASNSKPHGWDGSGRGNRRSKSRLRLMASRSKDARMHILFLSHYFPPEVNAPALRTYEHCRRWAARGHRVTVVTCAPNCPNGIVFDGYRNSWRSEEETDGR